MSDATLRDLERRFVETGDAADEAAWLREQVRAGQTLDWASYSRLAALGVDSAADYLRARLARRALSQQELTLAAYCSHPPARVVLGQAAPAAPSNSRRWATGLGGFGWFWAACVAIRILRMAAEDSEQLDDSRRAVLDAAEEFARTRDPSAFDCCRASWEAFMEGGGFHHGIPDEAQPSEGVRRAFALNALIYHVGAGVLGFAYPADGLIFPRASKGVPRELSARASPSQLSGLRRVFKEADNGFGLGQDLVRVESESLLIAEALDERHASAH